MILVDTSVWIDHLRRGDPTLVDLLSDTQVLGHPAVTGEIGLGSLADRDEVLALLAGLPQAPSATHDEVMTLVETRRLFGLGIGYVDAHLIASAALARDATLWTRDKRLRAATRSAGLDAGLS